jgi:hypothetical protein
VATAFATVTDTLLAVWTTLPGLAGVRVFDGVPVGDEAEALGEFVLVGHDGDPESTPEITVVQEWVDLACSRRAETGVVPCAVVVQSGDTDLSARRGRAQVLVSALADSIVTDMTLGGVVDSVLLLSGSARQLQTEQGTAVVLPFDITYRTTV